MLLYRQLPLNTTHNNLGHGCCGIACMKKLDYDRRTLNKRLPTYNVLMDEQDAIKLMYTRMVVLEMVYNVLSETLSLFSLLLVCS